MAGPAGPWGPDERPDSLSLYVHVPFCSRRCAFCDLTTGRPRGPQEPLEYLTMLRREIVRAGEEEAGQVGRPVPSIYFGGGTPTSVPAEGLVGVLWLLREVYGVPDDAEVTVEADPGTVDAESLVGLRRAGFNRISFGVQALDDAVLRRLGRLHDSARAEDAVRWAAEAGFASVSIDLILGLPQISRRAWRDGIDRVLAWPLSHVSIYALNVEPDTAFGRRQAAGRLHLPPEDAVIEMGDWAEARLAAAGFARYELSSYARPGFASTHNLGYWRGRDYRGFGAGAHSFVAGLRFWNERLPMRYIRAVVAGQSPRADEERLGPDLARAEAALLSLRTAEGIDRTAFRRRFGHDPAVLFASALDPLLAAGLVVVSETAVTLTPRGRWLYNPVARALLPERTAPTVAEGVRPA
jgi:oxygen-independent coproporphyrinogen-3 oxidase